MDVVKYRQTVFLPKLAELQKDMRKYNELGEEDAEDRGENVAPTLNSCGFPAITPQSEADHDNEPWDPTLPRAPRTPRTRVVIWWHDESIFYAHDRCKLHWVHCTETAKPYAKGEGQSFMIANFVSADYGWLEDFPNSRSARIELKPGKNRGGYFTNDEVLEQITQAMDLVEALYPDDRHVFVFDNATTHSKRADNALSARHMPKGTSPPGRNWKISVNKRDLNGKVVYGTDGKLVKEKICMGDASFADGTPQPLYFPLDHPTHPGLFKGITVILEERGFLDAKKTRAECRGFKCEKGPDGEYINCCCRQILFNQPDFTNVPSLLESHCAVRGYTVLFLPKFHPELNFIEQCWGMAKRIYREMPASSTMEDLEENTRRALASVQLVNMRKCVDSCRSL
jgi:hypothetical protein